MAHLTWFLWCLKLAVVWDKSNLVRIWTKILTIVSTYLGMSRLSSSSHCISVFNLCRRLHWMTLQCNKGMVHLTIPTYMPDNPKKHAWKKHCAVLPSFSLKYYNPCLILHVYSGQNYTLYTVHCTVQCSLTIAEYTALPASMQNSLIMAWQHFPV